MNWKMCMMIILRISSENFKVLGIKSEFLLNIFSNFTEKFH